MITIKRPVELAFRQASLPDVVSKLNCHLKSTGTNDIERAIGVRQKRIQELASEIETLREASKRVAFMCITVWGPNPFGQRIRTFSMS